MLQTYERNGKLKIAGTLISAAVICGTVVIADKIKSSDHTTVSSVATGEPTTSVTTVPQPTTTTSNSSDTASSSTTSSYKDGTYTASETYSVPHGEESMDVSITLANGVVTNSSIQNSESDRDSASYQEDFTASYKNYVVGDNISGLQLSRISGASDTTDAFNQALSRIAVKAKA